MTTGNRRTPPAGRPGARPLRSAPRRPFLQRNRGRLLWGLAAVALVGMASLAFLNATSPTYACGSEWTPTATPSPAPSATQHLGYVQTDLGNTHISPGSFQKYPFCPPASGKHYNASGSGPIRPGVFGPDDQTMPQGWLHNLEHGGLAILYRCTGSDTACSDAGQAAFKQFYQSFPNSPVCNLPPGSVGPVIARFDQMATPYAALVWGIELPLDSFDTAKILEFFQQSGERTNPEPLCAKPTATPGPTDTPAPSASPAPSAT